MTLQYFPVKLRWGEVLTPGTSAVCHAVVLSGSSRKTYRETDGLPNRSRHHKIHSECRMHLVNIITNSPVLTGDKLTHLTQLKMFLQLVCFYPSHESELRFSLSLSISHLATLPLSSSHTHTHTHYLRLWVSRGRWKAQCHMLNPPSVTPSL